MIAFKYPWPQALPAILAEYISANDLCQKHRDRLELHVLRFCEWHRALTCDADYRTESALLSAWLDSLPVELAPSTVNGHRQTIITLVRFCRDDGEPLPRADKIKRRKEPRRIKPAYRLEELHRLIEAAPQYKPMRHCRGRGNWRKKVPKTRPDGIPWGVWWEAFVRVGYESGQYLSDLRKIPWAHVNHDGVATFARHKTGKLMSFRLSERAIQSARALGHPRLILPWPYNLHTYFQQQWKRFARFAGVRLLTPKSIRRSAITYTYMQYGEEAARILAGHSRFSVTAEHYIDWSIATKPVVSPPPISPPKVR